MAQFYLLVRRKNSNFWEGVIPLNPARVKTFAQAQNAARTIVKPGNVGQAITSAQYNLLRKRVNALKRSRGSKRLNKRMSKKLNSMQRKRLLANLRKARLARKKRK